MELDIKHQKKLILCAMELDFMRLPALSQSLNSSASQHNTLSLNFHNIYVCSFWDILYLM
jgi:hypothetical protein